MTARNIEKILAELISLVLIAVPTIAESEAGGAADSAPKDARELAALVAPIALYPDPLVAQILAASTFPDQVAVADYWVQQNQALSGQALMEAVNKQSWNASVKALTQFPSVLHNLAQNLNWTSTLGETYHNQPSEVMSAIQTLRAQAKATGNLQSGPQITVTQESPQIIAIEPANPQVVYVPQYNPATIYGTPYVTPGYSAGDVALGSLLGFGSGVAVGALAGGDGWGWDSWGTNWSGGTLVYNHNNFYGNPAWHGGYYNGAYHDGYGYHNVYDHAAANGRGYANRAERNGNLNRSMVGGRAQDSNSWARADNSFRSSTAFSGFRNHSGGFGGFGGLGGWQSRAQSFRGWGSMRGGGFFGGRFGGGRFGGGGFHGGGFRR